MSVGHDSILHCRATGYPTPTITWTRLDRRPLSARANNSNADTIDFTNIQLDDDGEYVCTADNAAGTVTATTSLRVHQSPLISIQPDVTELKLTVGDELRLDCSATGLPSPQVQWIDQSNNAGGQRSLYGQLPASDGTRPLATMQKHKVHETDAGAYLCRATNEAGIEEKYIYVMVAEKRGDVGKYSLNKG